ncbi:MAG: integrase [Mycobacterium sp.]|uniref:integrase n=1 Tax=Mycobacterium sp. TaxID=1785 RepID=UPI003C6454FA
MRERLSRPVTPLRNAALAGFVTAAVLTCGLATGPAAMANAAPSDPGDQTTAEQRIIDGHVVKQRGCTHPALAPNPQGVIWDSPGFTPNAGGTGTVTDADPRLGGQFRADWVDGRWRIVYPYC